MLKNNNKFSEFYYIGEMIRSNKKNKEFFYELANNQIYGSCITNCIHLFSSFKIKSPKFVCGYFCNKTLETEFHCFLSFDFPIFGGKFILDPTRNILLFLHNNLMNDELKKTKILLNNDIITIHDSNGFGKYLILEDEKTILYDRFCVHWDEFMKSKGSTY
jgi:hypothetical protein